MTVNNLELFGENEGTMKSPILKWKERHGIKTYFKEQRPWPVGSVGSVGPGSLVESSDILNPWEAYTGTYMDATDQAMEYLCDHEPGTVLNTPTLCAGSTEELALWRLAEQLKIKLWNEEE